MKTTALGVLVVLLLVLTGPVNAAAAAPSGQVFNVRDFGATGDGTTLDTSAIQKALDECGDAGGGTVVLPPGKYLSQPLTIRTRTTLQLDRGATLQATDDPVDYQRTDKPDSFNPLLAGKDLEDVTIAGEGVIDGAGQKWWIDAEAARQKKSGYTLPRPNMIVLTRVTNLVVRNVTLQNAPKFHFVPTECDGVEVTGVTILAPERAPNTDGIDPSMCRNVTITNCMIDVGDDNIAIKSGKRAQGREFACENYTITNCTFKHGHGMSIGSEIVGGVRNVTVKDCTFEETDNGIRIKTDRSRGGAVENIVYENLRMKNVRGAIFIAGYYPKIPAEDKAKPVTDTTPRFRAITIRNLNATSTKGAGAIVGLPESLIDDVTLENVSIEAAQAGLEIRNARNVRMENVHVSAKKGKPVVKTNVEMAEPTGQGQ